jgi:hypothetical protein
MGLLCAWVADHTCSGGGSTRVGGVEMLGSVKDWGGSGGGAFITAGGPLGWHQILHWGRCSDCCLDDY